MRTFTTGKADCGLSVFWAVSKIHILWTCLGLPCFIFTVFLQLFLYFVLPIWIPLWSHFSALYSLAMLPNLLRAFLLCHRSPLWHKWHPQVRKPFPVIPSEGNRNVPTLHSELKAIKKQWTEEKLSALPTCQEAGQILTNVSLFPFLTGRTGINHRVTLDPISMQMVPGEST